MGGPSDLITMIAQATPADGVVQIKVTLKIKAGWHVNSNPAAQEWLIPTTLDFRGNGIAIERVAYPVGKTMKFEFSDDELLVYDGTTTLRATVRLADSGTPRLTVTLKYQACNDQACLAPDTLETTLTLARN